MRFMWEILELLSNTREYLLIFVNPLENGSNLVPPGSLPVNQAFKSLCKRWLFCLVDALVDAL